jgi:hypothetical protein
MSKLEPNDDGPAGFSSLLDEVRAIRRQVTDPFGENVEQLCDHLREVEREYATRSGRFAGLFTTTAAEVVASWGPEIYDLSDPLIDEIRAIRGRIAKERGWA